MAVERREDIRAWFNELYTAFDRGLLAYLITQTHDAELAADLAQITWEQVWKALPRTASASFMWVRKIAYNTWINEHRRMSNRALLSLDDEQVFADVESLPAPGDDPEAIVITREQFRDCRELLAALPYCRRVAITMFAEECSYQEIMEHLGISYETATGHVQKARKQLREMRK